MELEISIQMMTSTPCRFSLLIFDPICGRASMRMRMMSAAMMSQNFTAGLYFDTPCIMSLRSCGSPKRFNFRILLRWYSSLITTSTGTSSKR